MAEPVQREWGWTDLELLEMPVGRFWARLESYKERKKEEDARWLTGLWMVARSISDAMLLERELPYHEKESPPKADRGEVIRTRNQLKTEKSQIADALTSPRHFGSRFGLGHILGEPEQRIQPAKPHDVKKEIAEREARLLASLQAAAARGEV